MAPIRDKKGKEWSKSALSLLKSTTVKMENEALYLENITRHFYDFRSILSRPNLTLSGSSGGFSNPGGGLHSTNNKLSNTITKTCNRNIYQFLFLRCMQNNFRNISDLKSASSRFILHA